MDDKHSEDPRHVEIYLLSWVQTNLFGITALAVSVAVNCVAFTVFRGEAAFAGMLLSALAVAAAWHSMANYMNSALVDWREGLSDPGDPDYVRKAFAYHITSVALVGASYCAMIVAAWQHFYG